MNSGNFFAELKRRNVYKVAATYAVISWLLMQAASILFPTFDAPSWLMKALVTVLALGFLFALIIAWAFEMTPQGMKRTEDLSPDEVLPYWSGRKFGALIATFALVALALFAFQSTGREWLRKQTNGSEAQPNVNVKSVAVLPFLNMSDDKQNAYFADGVQEEILTTLAKVADLKVISRTSVMQFRDADTRNLRDIAQQLGVAHVLEGSVQRAADRVRVTAQLIDARTDAHLWADHYDRELSDVFAIQSEIAQKIAQQLQAALSPKEKAAMEAKPTNDLLAYDLYLRARVRSKLLYRGDAGEIGKGDALAGRSSRAGRDVCAGALSAGPGASRRLLVQCRFVAGARGKRASGSRCRRPRATR